MKKLILFAAATAVITMIDAQLLLTLNDTSGFYACTVGRSATDNGGGGYRGSLYASVAVSVEAPRTPSECLQLCRTTPNCFAIDQSGLNYENSICVLWAFHVVSNGLTGPTDRFGISCDKCRPGFYCPNGTAMACPAGQTSPNGASYLSQCFCQVGTVSNGTQCSPCPPGASCAGGNATISPCPAGSFCAGGQAARVCPVNTFSATNASFCQPCPAGQHTTGLTGQTACIPSAVVFLNFGSPRAQSVADVRNGATVASWSDFNVAIINGSTAPTLVTNARSEDWYMSMKRTHTHYFQRTAPTSMRYATGGGVTMLALVRFTGSPGNYERIVDIYNGTSDFLVLAREGTTAGVRFDFVRQGRLVYFTTVSSVIVQNAWMVIGVRATSPGTVVIRLNGTQVSSNPLAAVPDFVYSSVLVGMSAWSVAMPGYQDEATSMDLAYLGVWGTFLSDETYTALESRLLAIQARLRGLSTTSLPDESIPLIPPMSFRSKSCSAGYFGTDNGCMQCPISSYCLGGASPAVACPVGQVTLSAGASSASSCGCATGTYLTNGICQRCPLNAYCLFGSTAPVFCNGELRFGGVGGFTTSSSKTYYPCNGETELCPWQPTLNGISVVGESQLGDSTVGLGYLFDGSGTWFSRQTLPSYTDSLRGNVSTTDPPAIRFMAPFLISLKSYSLESFWHAGSGGEIPTSWTIDGWNGTQWVLVENRVSVNWTAGITRTFTLSSSFHRAFRFNFRSNNNDFNPTVPTEPATGPRIILAEFSLVFSGEPGARTARPGLTSSASCLDRAGSFTQGESAVLCPRNRYCPAGATSSIACGANSATDGLGAMSSAECICNAGYYGANGVCTECPIGAFCPRGTIEPRHCNSAYTFPAPGDMELKETTLETVMNEIRPSYNDLHGVPVHSYVSRYNVSADSVDFNLQALISLAFDGSNRTVYVSGHAVVGYSQSLTGPAVTIRVDAPGPQRLASFSMRVPQDRGSMAPTRFTLEGLSGSDWTLIQTFDSPSWSAGEARAFVFTTTQSFSSYRWRITACNNETIAGACTISLSWMQLNFAAMPVITTLGTGAGSLADCKCPLGMFGPVHDCQPCQSGSFCPFGSLTPLQCDANAYAVASSSVCLCRPGYFVGLNGTCQACPVNSYCPGNTTTATSCPNDTMTLTNMRTRVEDCKCSLAGMTGNGTCTPCPVNSTCAGNGTDPVPCPKNSGTLTEGSTAPSDCACNAGYYGRNGVCTSCPQGAVCPRGSTMPLACPAQTFTVANRSTVMTDCVCEAGKYNVSGQCKPCPLNHFCPLGSGHVPCGTNAITLGGGCENVSDCTCAVGHEPDVQTASSLTCRACAEGTFKATAFMTKCSSCPTKDSLCVLCGQVESPMCSQCGYTPGMTCSTSSGAFGMNSETTIIVGFSMMFGAILLSLVTIGGMTFVKSSGKKNSQIMLDALAVQSPTIMSTATPSQMPASMTFNRQFPMSNQQSFQQQQQQFYR